MVNIKKYNTFSVNVEAKRFEILSSKENVIDFIKDVGTEFVVIGEGSNLLFVSPVVDVACKIDIRGIKEIGERDEFCYVEVGAGENWSDFVDYSVYKGWGGIENLAMIPGTVGAAAVQNIGAYGVEVGSVIESVNYIDRYDLYEYSITNSECKFGYRDSIFKRELKNRTVINRVVFKLSKRCTPNTNYKDLRQFMSENDLALTIKNVCSAVKAIRSSKLPNVSEIGSAGSFFKNPVISSELYENLKFIYSDMPAYKMENGYKLSAAWLIEKAGLKGYRVGDTAVYNKHSLILVNYGDATGADIDRMSTFVIEIVKSKFGVELEPEVIRI